MKKVMGVLALLAFVGNVASAELLKNFKYDGKIEVNAVTVKNANDGDSDTKDTNSDVASRVQINAGFDLNDDANAVVSIVKNDRQYGEGSQDANTITTKLFFEQAYINLKGVLGFDHKLGRQYYGNEGDLVVYYGPKNWPLLPRIGAAMHMPVTAIDAYTGWYKTGKLDIHGLAGKTANNNGAVTDTVDVDVNGIVAKYALMDEVTLGAYVYEQKAYKAVGTKDLTLDVVGVKAMGKVSGIEYYGELATNYGHIANAATDKAAAGMAFLANAKYNMDLAGKLTLMGEYAMGSGNDKTTDKKDKAFYGIASDYRPGLLWGTWNTGLTGTIVGADSGLTTWNVGAKWNPSKVEKLDLCAKYIYLAPTEDKQDGATIGYDTVGSEFDLAATWNHSENLNVKAYMAYFMPDKDFATANGATNDDAATMLGAAFTVKF